MRIWATLHKNNKIIQNVTAESTNDDPAFALMECLEYAYKKLDLAEPVWVKKHATDLSRFGRTRFYPDDFMEPVAFDWFEVERLKEDE